MTIRKLKSCHHIILTLALITRVSPFYQRLPLLPTLAFVTSHYPLLPHITPCCLTLLLLPHIAFYYPRLTLLSHITPCYLTLPLTTHIGLFHLTLSLAGYLTLPLVTSNCFLLPTLPLVTSHYLLLPTLDRFSSHYPLLPHITPCKGQESSIQNAVHTFSTRETVNKFELKEPKCKELRISFTTKLVSLDPIVINGKDIYVVPKAKDLGLTLSSNLKWNNHVDEIVKKSHKRLYCLSQLKRSRLRTPELIQFYRTCIRPITEYPCPVFHDSLPAYLSKDIECIQRRAMRISFPSLSYQGGFGRG